MHSYTSTIRKLGTLLQHLGAASLLLSAACTTLEAPVGPTRATVRQGSAKIRYLDYDWLLNDVGR